MTDINYAAKSEKNRFKDKKITRLQYQLEQKGLSQQKEFKEMSRTRNKVKRNKKEVNH